MSFPPSSLGASINTGVTTSENVNLQGNVGLNSNDSLTQTSRNAANSFLNSSILLNEPLKANDEILIKSYILGEKSPTIKKTEGLELILSIENNKQNILTREVLENIKNYKIEINKNLYEKLENKADQLFSLNDNNSKFINSFFNSIKDFDSIETNIENGIEEKTKKIKENNFESILKKYVLEENNSSKYFNKITNHLISNMNKENESKYIIESEAIKEMSYNSESSAISFLNKDFFEKHNLITLSINNDNEYTKEIRSTTNDMIIQNIVTMIRNLYFVSPGSLIGNYKNEKFITTNYDTESLICFKYEVDNFNIFKNINFNEDIIDIDIITNNSILKENTNSHLASCRQVFLDSTISVLNGIQYLPSELTRYVNETMIENLKSANHIKSYEFGTNPNAIFHPHEVTVAKEVNKLYTGNFFDIDLAKLDVIKDLGTFSLLGAMLFGSGESNVVIDLFKENYVHKQNNEIIYKYKYPITTYVNNRDNHSGQIRSSNYLNIDYDGVSHIDSLEYKIKLDSFVKKQKLKHLKTKKINLDFCKQLIENIKKTSLKNKMISYSKNNNELLSVVSESNDIFKLLFTVDDDSVYSHIDLLSNHTIDNTSFLGIDSMKKNEVDINKDYESVRSNLKALFANYYTNNAFISSSRLFKEILSSVVNEARTSDDIEYEDFNLTQILYFNFFKKDFSDNNDVKDLVCERFIKKAIQLDTVSSRNFRKSNKLKSYAYDINSILEEDFDNTSKSEMSSYIDKVLASSEKLKILKANIFGAKNLNNLKLITDYKRVSNSNFTVSGYDSDYNMNLYSLSSIINFNILPNYCMLYNFTSGGVFNEDANVSYHIDKDNGLIESIVYGGLNDGTGERSVIKENYYINRNDSIFDVTKSEHIQNKLTPKLCKSDTNRENHEFPFVVIEDCFDKIFKSENSKSYVFYKLIDIIQDLLRLNIENYEKLSFSSEDDISSFLDENKHLKSEISTLIELFSKIYLIYSARLQRIQALKIFNWQKKDISHGPAGRGNNVNFSYNGIISKHSNVFNRFKNVMDLNNTTDNINIITREQSEDAVKDIRELCDIFENNSDTLLQNLHVESTQASWKTHITVHLYNIMQSLFLSDTSQAFTFDVINGFINHQRFIIESERDDVTSSESFNMIEELSRDAVEEIENNFYNLFYINNLSKRLTNISLKNKINNNLFLNSFENNGNDFYKNLSIFKNSKNSIKESIENTGNTFHNDIFSKEVFLSNPIDFLNSNISSFGIKSKLLNNYSYDTIIKISVSIVDKFNLNNFYIPKVFIFSPMITDTLYLTRNMLNTSNISNINSLSSVLCVYNIKENIKNRLGLFNFQDLLIDNTHFLVSVLKSKFSLNDDDAFSLFKHLIYCHLGSNELAKMTSNIYNIDNISNYKEKKPIDSNIFDLVNNLGEKQFFDIFDSNKDLVFDDFILDENNKYRVPLGYDTIEKNNVVYSLLNNLNNLSSSESIEEFILNEYYDIYNIAINPKSFYFVDTALNNNRESAETNSLQNILNKILNVDEFVNNNKLESSSLEIDNFNIIFKTEIL
jgi:hypothetical protein